MNRRDFMTTLSEGALSAVLPGYIQQNPYEEYKPNSLVEKVVRAIKNDPHVESGEISINGQLYFKTYKILSRYADGLMYDLIYSDGAESEFGKDKTAQFDRIGKGDILEVVISRFDPHRIGEEDNVLYRFTDINLTGEPNHTDDPRMFKIPKDEPLDNLALFGGEKGREGFPGRVYRRKLREEVLREVFGIIIPPETSPYLCRLPVSYPNKS